MTFEEYMDSKATQRIKKYELVANGCHYDETEAASFRKAREYFADKWNGCYTIVCHNTDERRNVRL
jgi:hypothetical protein